MPCYCFKCPVCNHQEEVVREMKNSDNPYCCPVCADEHGNEVLMNRDLRAEHGRGNVDGLMNDHPRYSASGGVLDEDLAAARKVHPGREFKKFGNSWRPLIKNRVDKIKYMKECGAYEY